METIVSSGYTVPPTRHVAKAIMDSREYLNFAAFSDEASEVFKIKIDLHCCYKNRLQLACTRVVRIQMEPLPEG